MKLLIVLSSPDDFVSELDFLEGRVSTTFLRRRAFVFLGRIQLDVETFNFATLRNLMSTEVPSHYLTGTI